MKKFAKERIGNEDVRKELNLLSSLEVIEERKRHSDDTYIWDERNL